MRAARPKKISYGAGNPYTVEFAYENRPDRAEHYDQTVYQVFWSRKRLSEITVKVGGAIARKYTLGSGLIDTTAPSQKKVLLTGITQIGKDEVGALPTTTYAYSVTGDLGQGSLLSLDNGYGGAVSFAYNSCLGGVGCFVTQETRIGGVSSDQDIVTTCAYGAWVGNDIMGNDINGFDHASATLVGSGSPDAIDQHWFYTDAVKKGREYKT